MGMKLFDDDDNVSEDLSKIEINHEFVKRYEHNKKREDLQRYEELKKQGRIDSSSSDASEGSSSEEEELIKRDKKSDVKFLEALIKVKNQDPVLREKDAKLFDSESENEDDSEGDGKDAETGKDVEKKKKKKKPMYLKDVVSKHLIEAGPEFDDENGDRSESDDEIENKVKSYSEEQEELRREFLDAAKDAEDDGEEELFKVKDNRSKDDEDEDEDDDEIVDKLDEYFGEDEKLDEDSKFLKDYFRKRMWADDGKDKGGVDEEIEFSEDEEEIEKQDDYERGYNFRFEENADDRILGHSRRVEGSVRKKDNARKKQRERKEERIAQAEAERKEEVKRLKNLKKKEIKEKLEKIKKISGLKNEVTSFIDEGDLEEEFNPEEYSKKMNAAFGDDYYGAKDVDPRYERDRDDEEDESDIEKPDFDKEDEELGLPKGWDQVEEPVEGFDSFRQRMVEQNGDGDDITEEAVQKAIDEYHKLNYEGTAGGIRTRFKYKKVEGKRYGLTVEEILSMDETELNQYVSLKKLAPYREKEWKVPRIKTFQLKQKLKEGKTFVPNKEDNKKRARDSKETNEMEKVREQPQPAESSGDKDKDTLSRRSKRRKRQAELKLSHSRLMAYGKIPSKSKSKNQH